MENENTFKFTDQVNELKDIRLADKVVYEKIVTDDIENHNYDTDEHAKDLIPTAYGVFEFVDGKNADILQAISEQTVTLTGDSKSNTDKIIDKIESIPGCSCDLENLSAHIDERFNGTDDKIDSLSGDVMSKLNQLSTCSCDIETLKTHIDGKMTEQTQAIEGDVGSKLSDQTASLTGSISEAVTTITEKIDGIEITDYMPTIRALSDDVMLKFSDTNGKITEVKTNVTVGFNGVNDKIDSLSTDVMNKLNTLSTCSCDIEGLSVSVMNRFDSIEATVNNIWGLLSGMSIQPMSYVTNVSYDDHAFKQQSVSCSVLGSAPVTGGLSTIVTCVPHNNEEA